MLFAIEGVNEPDERRDDWVLRTQEEQRRHYETIKEDAATKAVPVAVSSLANLRDSPGRLGDLSAQLLTRSATGIRIALTPYCPGIRADGNFRTVRVSLRKRPTLFSFSMLTAKDLAGGVAERGWTASSMPAYLGVSDLGEKHWRFLGWH
jgi:hypothetical protein